jgi:REP element-mobilizing transposase RayT
MKPKKEHYRGKLPHFQQPGQWYFVTCILKGAMPKGAMDKYTTKLETAKNRYLLLKEKADAQGVGLSKVQHSDFRKSKPQLARARKDYYTALRKYRLAYDKILHQSKEPTVNLTKENNRKLIEEALLFWEGKRLKNHAWCIMSNHFHWVLTVSDSESNFRESDFLKSDNFELGNSKSLPGELDFPKSNTLTSESQSPGGKLDFPNSGNKKTPVYLQDILHSVKLYTARRINQNENRSGQLWEHESFDTTIRNERHFATVVNYTLNNPVAAGLVKDWHDWPGSRSFL